MVEARREARKLLEATPRMEAVAFAALEEGVATWLDAVPRQPSWSPTARSPK